MKLSLTPSLPSLRKLPLRTAIDGAIGAAYGLLFRVNPLVTMTVFATRAVAETVLFLIPNLVLHPKKLKSQQLFVITAAVTNFAFIAALRKMKLMGDFLSCAFAVAVIGQMIYRVHYIQEQERAASR